MVEVTQADKNLAATILGIAELPARASHVRAAERTAANFRLAHTPASGEVVVWQRRRMWLLNSDEPGKIYQWHECRAEEATGHFDKAPGYEYRALYAAPSHPSEDVAEMVELLQRVHENTCLPEPNCSCHISPPCSDCFDNLGARELDANIAAALSRYAKGGRDEEQDQPTNCRRRVGPCFIRDGDRYRHSALGRLDKSRSASGRRRYWRASCTRRYHVGVEAMTLPHRVEAAEGANRELDCRIWCEVTRQDFEIAQRVVSDFGQWRAPYYTASIDAALTLVPEGWRTSLSNLGGIGWFASVMEYGGSHGEAFSRAATPALVLCVAALRARESNNGE